MSILRKRCRHNITWMWIGVIGFSWMAFRPAAAQPGTTLDDLTAGFIHLSPTVVQTTNGCAPFQVHVFASVTDAAVFSLKFFFDSGNVELISVSHPADTTVHLMPEAMIADTLWIDGFFEPNRTGPSIHIATVTGWATSPNDTTTLIGFLMGTGYGGVPSNIDTILFAGDSTTIMVEGTAPLPPEGLIVETLPLPANGDSVQLHWRPVIQDVDGDPVTNPLYQVYFVNVLTDSVFHIGSTLDTFYYDDTILTGVHVIQYDSLGVPVDTSNVGMYFIQSCKTQP